MSGSQTEQAGADRGKGKGATSQEESLSLGLDIHYRCRQIRIFRASFSTLGWARLCTKSERVTCTTGLRRSACSLDPSSLVYTPEMETKYPKSSQ